MSDEQHSFCFIVCTDIVLVHCKQHSDVVLRSAKMSWYCYSSLKIEVQQVEKSIIGVLQGKLRSSIVVLLYICSKYIVVLAH